MTSQRYRQCFASRPVKTGAAAGALRLGLIALLTLISASNDTLADDTIGQASVIDGDTLEIHSTRIRLWGIDAPESTQLCRGEDSDPYRCGAQAANDLDTIHREAACELRSNQSRPLRAHGSDVLCRRCRSWRMARAEWLGCGLAAILAWKIRRSSARS